MPGQRSNDEGEYEGIFRRLSHDCPDTCAMLYTVEGDKLINVRGNPKHPITRGDYA